MDCAILRIVDEKDMARDDVLPGVVPHHPLSPPNPPGLPAIPPPYQVPTNEGGEYCYADMLVRVLVC
jgi:hypothetical protein